MIGRVKARARFPVGGRRLLSRRPPTPPFRADMDGGLPVAATWPDTRNVFRVSGTTGWCGMATPGPSLSVMRALSPWSWNSIRVTVGSCMPISGIGSERRTIGSGSISSMTS